MRQVLSKHQVQIGTEREPSNNWHNDGPISIQNPTIQPTDLDLDVHRPG
jgi:hypothetical protein